MQGYSSLVFRFVVSPLPSTFHVHTRTSVCQAIHFNTIPFSVGPTLMASLQLPTRCWTPRTHGEFAHL